ncbi:MAG: permease [Dethiobacteria bacterium]|nr:permease [Dethiobacteria bacterium]
MKLIKPYLLLILVVVIDLVIIITNPELGIKIMASTRFNFLTMLAILPPIFLLIGLLDVWVPREQFMRFMGEKSGVVGISLSILLGAAAAGPLYAAFPLAAIMIQKGVKFSNVLIFLGAWSTMKIPMVLFEITALGSQFALIRWVISVIGIIIMALLISKMISKTEQSEIYARHANL